ncbi:hypothetical protein BU25DRAFT_411713 [Macroventuria anomochaeta]|uniref:Uncharacterized protein n=1 Tax=Macroventuria anomochaeta TaxID=301207 RepID=A0ACB6RWY5_9PLEO|nr:uncharacterized protein BU25DRAFT_411713 [Macroventuria anomochaeta]KAF2626298.1 hypothetical protein BU25DRAFT_411713 [Macroventuria anomochaeta]
MNLRVVLRLPGRSEPKASRLSPTRTTPAILPSRSPTNHLPPNTLDPLQRTFPPRHLTLSHAILCHLARVDDSKHHPNNHPFLVPDLPHHQSR